MCPHDRPSHLLLFFQRQGFILYFPYHRLDLHLACILGWPSFSASTSWVLELWVCGITSNLYLLYANSFFYVLCYFILLTYK